MKQFQIKINDGKALLNLATSARGRLVSPPCAPMSTMLHGLGSNSWETLFEDFEDYEEVDGDEDDLEEVDGNEDDLEEVDGDEGDLEEDHDDQEENDLEQGDPGVLKLLWHFLPSVIPLCKSRD